MNAVIRYVRSCSRSLTIALACIASITVAAAVQAGVHPQLSTYRLDHTTDVDALLQQTLDALDTNIRHDLDLPADKRAFGVLDLTGLQYAALRPDALFYGASVPKICIVAAYFQQHPEAATRLDPIVARELQLILKRSDNDLAAKYSRMVGLETIQALQQSPRYRLYDKDHGGGLWCGKHYGSPTPRTGDPIGDFSHAATVRQCLRYYLLLEQGRLVSPAASARIKQLFAAPWLPFHNDDFVRGLNGRDVTIIRKNGLWEDWHLDTARIAHGDRVYLLAGMVHDANGQNYLARMAAAIDEKLCGRSKPAPYRHRLNIIDEPVNVLPAESLSKNKKRRNSYTYEPVLTEYPFNEAVMSWNIDMPAAAGYGVEFRAGRRFDDHWTSFMRIGEGGEPTCGAEDWVTECDGGHIATDYFVSDEFYDRYQVRVRVHVDQQNAENKLGGPAALTVRRLAVCYSDTTGIPDSIRRVPRRDTASPAPPPYRYQRHLPVPPRSQRSEREDIAGRICSPTSLAMVLAYRGIDKPTPVVADACYDQRHDIYGNWPLNVQAAYRLGLPGYLTRISDWRVAERYIADRQPLVASIRVPENSGVQNFPYSSTAGHLIVITGFDDKGGVLVNDPAVADPSAIQRTYRRVDLEKVWMHGSGGLAYVLEPAHAPK